MKKLIYSVIFIVLGTLSSFAQVNAYKYVIVPNEFEFLREADQYQLNSLTKFLFEKYGFTAFLEGEQLPLELAGNRCKALTAFVKNESGIFSTKFYVGLKDCNNKEIFISKEGTSRTKEYKVAYHEALRDAFQSVAALNYSYNNSDALKSTDSTSKKEDIAVVEVVAVPTAINRKDEHITGNESKKQSSEDRVDDKISGKLSFEMNGNTFILKKADKGYNFFQNGMTEPFAALIASNKENNFIYSSVTNQGMAYFNKDGDLLIELLDRATNSINTLVYKLKN